MRRRRLATASAPSSLPAPAEEPRAHGLGRVCRIGRDERADRVRGRDHRTPGRPDRHACRIRTALGRSGLRRHHAGGLRGLCIRRPQASSAPTTQPVIVAPPFPEGPTHAQPAAQSAIAAGATQGAATQRLLEDTTAALARQVMFQLASAPATQRAGDPNNAHWLFELPLATPQGTAVAQFEIDRDGGGGGGQGKGDDSHPSWRARFSLDLGEMGPVHVQVSLGGGRAGVSLWAENPETAGALRAGRSDLADDFKADAVDAEVAVFLGQPPAPAPGLAASWIRPYERDHQKAAGGRAAIR